MLVSNRALHYFEVVSALNHVHVRTMTRINDKILEGITIATRGLNLSAQTTCDDSLKISGLLYPSVAYIRSRIVQCKDLHRDYRTARLRDNCVQRSRKYLVTVEKVLKMSYPAIRALAGP